MPNKGMEPTASSVRSFLAPASSSGSYLALGGARISVEDSWHQHKRAQVRKKSAAVRIKCAACGPRLPQEGAGQCANLRQPLQRYYRNSHGLGVTIESTKTCRGR